MNDRLVGAPPSSIGAARRRIFFGRTPCALRSAVPNTVEALVPTAGWRIYTIGDRMPAIDPAAWRLGSTASSRLPALRSTT